MIKGYQAEIEKIYNNIRESEDVSLRARRAEIKGKLPSVIQIESEIGKLCVQLSTSSFKEIPNRDTFLNNLRNKITDLRVKKYEILVQNGYPQNYVERQYTCIKCKDTGFINAEKCSCYKSKVVQLYYNNSDLRGMLEKDNFENFNFELFSNYRMKDEPDSPRKNIERIFSKVWSYINEFQNTDENLLFYGNSGTGKTFLSHCLARELLDRGNLVVYRTADDLIQNLKSIKLDNDLNLEDLLFNCDLLIIDDLGTEQINSFSKTELFNFINKRLLKRRKMLISTNYDLEMLSKTYSERLTSRLFGNFTLYKFLGDDIRVKVNLSKIK